MPDSMTTPPPRPMPGPPRATGAPPPPKPTMAPGGAPPPPPPGDNPVQRLLASVPEPTEQLDIKALKQLEQDAKDAWAAIKKIAPKFPVEVPDVLLPPDYMGDGKVPDSLVVATFYLLAIVDQALGGGSRYAVDTDLLETTEGIKELATMVGMLAKDKKALDAFTKAAMADGLGEEEDTSEEEMAPPPKGDGGPPPMPPAARAGRPPMATPPK